MNEERSSVLRWLWKTIKLPEARQWVFGLLAVIGGIVGAIYILRDPSRLKYYTDVISAIPKSYFYGLLGVLLAVAVSLAFLQLGELAGRLKPKGRETEKVKEKAIAKTRQKAHPLFVSELFARAFRGQALFSCGILATCFWIAIAKEDYTAAGIIGAVVVAIAGFGWLTKLRAEHGWFADNQYEVLELLHFIIAESKSGGLPPGSRISRQKLETHQLSTSSQEKLGSLP